MSNQTSKTPTQNKRLSYSYQHRDKMPGVRPSIYAAAPNMGVNFQIERDSPLIARQMAGQRMSEAERRHSYMISRQRPQPVLKPSPRLALGPDRAAFNEAMSVDRLEAARLNKKAQREEGRNQTRAQYIQERQQAARLTAKRQFHRANDR